MSETELLKKRLLRPSKVAIITHRNPDGDAIGSSIATYRYLIQLGHDVTMIAPSEYPVLFKFLPDIEKMLIYDLHKDDVKTAIAEAGILFCLDFNSLDRIDPLATDIDSSKAYKILIDHHLDPEPFADYYLSDTDASSTSELVYRFVESLGDLSKVDLDMATCLFTGILTDTGSFKYATNPEVYRIASELKKMGIDDYKINDIIFNSQTERQLRILGHALYNRMEVIPALQTGLIYLTKSDYHKYQISRGDTEGLVNHILMIEGINIAGFIREMPAGEIRLSLRSKGDISVQELARDHFSGGGHKNASGGSSDLPLRETIEKFKRVVSFYIK